MPKQLSLQFDIPKIKLAEKGELKKPHRSGIIYSTRPLIALAENGSKYILKGPDINLVIAEYSAYLLARHINIPVPDYGLAYQDDSYYFASKEIKIKDVEDILTNAHISNREDIPGIIAFDILISNYDRNMGNFVASIDKIETPPVFYLYAIDFEKSRVLNPANILVLNNHEEDYWPNGILGDILSGIHVPPEQTLRSISALPDNDQIFHHLERLYDTIKADKNNLLNMRRLLRDRANNITTLIRRYWK